MLKLLKNFDFFTNDFSGDSTPPPVDTIRLFGHILILT